MKKLLIPFLFIDSLVDTFFAPVTELWCKLTGRTNIAFASVLVVGACVVWVTDAYLTGGIVNGVFFLVLMGFVVWIRLGAHAEVREYLEHPPDHLPRMFVSDILIRALFLIPFITMITIWDGFTDGLGLDNLGGVFYLWSWYAVWQFNAGGKSKIKEGVKKLTDMAAQAKLSLRPLPAPTAG